MIRFALVGWLSWTLIPPFASAQQVHESGAVMEVVERLFDAMRAGDSAAARSTFAADASIVSSRPSGRRTIKCGTSAFGIRRSASMVRWPRSGPTIHSILAIDSAIAGSIPSRCFGEALDGRS